MQLWTAFLLGLAGSLHCAGMCGPLVLALPVTSSANWPFVLGRGIYQFGRLITYTTLGALLGALGHTLALAGWQRWVSIVAGGSILAGLFVSSNFPATLRVARMVGLLKAGLGRLLRQRSLVSLLLLGVLNGLLPCGLVYAASAGALAAGDVVGGARYMFAFGLGTVPLMLGLALAGKRLQVVLRFKLEKLIPICLLLMAAMLILRGLSLGIPYLSPTLSVTADGHVSCH
ncbi:MAG: sulfite exporter TauE/SafE family protein [Verrucomicrobia bacterium]|nr:sulfite exporter TauE/SafE family protein [Verrucomicrobiota bacterium]